MERKIKHSVGAFALNVIIAIIVVASGIYALIEKKMIISGIYSGNLYSLGEAESILIATAQFMIASFLILILFENKLKNKLGEWLLMLGIILFLSSAFV